MNHSKKKSFLAQHYAKVKSFAKKHPKASAAVVAGAYVAAKHIANHVSLKKHETLRTKYNMDRFSAGKPDTHFPGLYISQHEVDKRKNRK